MYRVILEAVIAVLFVTLLRAVLGTILKGFSELFRPSAPPSSGPATGASQRVPTTDELKKDPVCGTFIAASTSLQKTISGDTYYFCSPECRDKFRAPAARSGVRKAG